MTQDIRWPNWLGVVVDDLAKQRHFYGSVLGFRELAAGEGWVHFDLGFPRLLELCRRDASPQYERRRYQPGFAVDDIHAVRKRLIDDGTEAISEVEGGPASHGYWCYFRDPEGNVFEVSQRLGDSWQAADGPSSGSLSTDAAGGVGQESEP